MPWRREKNIGMTEATCKIGISPERLRYWEIRGIISPLYIRHGSKRLRRYSHEDIAISTDIRHLVDQDGFTLKGAAERLNRPYKD